MKKFSLVILMTFIILSLFGVGFYFYNRSFKTSAPCYGEEIGVNPEKIINLKLTIFRDDRVEEIEGPEVKKGYTSSLPWPDPTGDYMLKIVDSKGKPICVERFNLYFGYTGPAVAGVDYSDILYDEFFFSVRLPFKKGMHKVILFHNDQIIWSKVIKQK